MAAVAGPTQEATTLLFPVPLELPLMLCSERVDEASSDTDSTDAQKPEGDRH